MMWKGRPVILDQAHLDIICNGDKDLQVEMLALYLVELQRLKAQLQADPGPQSRRNRLLAIEQSSQKIGARNLAAACRALVEGEPDALSDLRGIEESINAVVRHIETQSG